MSGIDTMKMRLYQKGGKQIGRMEEDKLRGLRQALLYSYQSATAVLQDGREFLCLMNPDKLNNSYDNKIISIPFRDICLNKPIIEHHTTTQGLEEIGMKPGDVFEWKETNTYWIVYLRYLEERAYFRAEVRKCESEADVDGTPYRVYFKGPQELNIEWKKIRNAGIINTENYSGLMYITRDEKTEEFFHRFTIVKIDDKPYEVQVVNRFGGDGILEVAVKEWFQNSIEDAKKEADKEAEALKPVPSPEDPQIVGPAQVDPYGIVTYSIANIAGDCVWSVNEEAEKKILFKDNNNTGNEVTLYIATNKKMNFTLSCNDVTIDVEVLSL